MVSLWSSKPLWFWGMIDRTFKGNKYILWYFAIITCRLHAYSFHPIFKGAVYSCLLPRAYNRSQTSHQWYYYSVRRRPKPHAAVSSARRTKWALQIRVFTLYVVITKMISIVVTPWLADCVGMILRIYRQNMLKQWL